jgi:hypothetical protein
MAPHKIVQAIMIEWLKADRDMARLDSLAEDLIDLVGKSEAALLLLNAADQVLRTDSP